MIFRVNGYNEPTATYFVADQATADVIKQNPYIKATVLVGTKSDAENFLLEKQKKILETEASRFHVCATFVVGNDHVWRALEDADPEDTICQVLDHLSGTYIQCATKTEGFARNAQVKQEFLESIGLGAVVELEVVEPMQSVIAKDNNQIPVEKL